MKSRRKSARQSRSIGHAHAKIAPPIRSHRPVFETLEQRHLLAADLLITELMAINQNTVVDEDGDSSDWFEIKNVSSGEIDLAGWYVTDDPTDLVQWQFPSVTLDAGELLTVFASGKNRTTGGPLHTNFSLSGDGETLTLVRPDGFTVEHALDFPAQLPDISYGLPNTNAFSTSLLSPDTPLRYHVPSIADANADWTAVGFDDSTWTATNPVNVPPLAITEVSTGDTKLVEIQNLAGQAVDATGWRVLINNAAGGIDSVNGTAWNLNGTITSGEVRYQTNQVGDNHWGSSIDWSLEGNGWAMIVDDSGTVVDFLAWGYTDAQIAALNVDFGPFANISVGDQWTGVGADAGSSFIDAGFVAYNDQSAGAGTHANATVYGANGTAAGLLRDVTTGADASATLTTSHAGVLFQGGGGSPATGTHAHDLFDGFVNFAGSGGNSLEVNVGDNYTHTFSGLDSGDQITYDFAGTAVRGNVNYTNRWTLVTLQGAASATPAHSNGIGLIQISPTEVALWTGHNSGSGQGFVAAWNDIDPGVDGQFEIVSTQYTGATPGVGNGTANGSKGYGLAGIRLEEVVPSELGVLRRVGLVDSNGGSDFERVSVATKGLTNPTLTVPFPSEVPATAGIGFSDDQPAFEAQINTDVGAVMQGVNATLWTRFEFDVTDPTGLEILTLEMMYDDGVVAYLNGTEIAKANTPETIEYDSAADEDRNNIAATVFESFEVNDGIDELVPGTNVLAIGVLNVSANDTDLLLSAKLTGGTLLPAPQYMTTPTHGADNVAGAIGIVDDTAFSIDRGFYDAPIQVAITTDTLDAEIRYTTNGLPPTATTGSVYVGPITVDETTTLRAAAYKPGFIPTNVDTHTYIYVDDVIQQDYQATLDAGFPASWNGTSPDYGIDTDVVGPNDLFGGVYAASIRDDLKSIPTLSIVSDVDGIFGTNGIYSNPQNHNLEVPTSFELINPDGSPGFQVDAGLKIQGGAFRSFGLTKKNSLRLKFTSNYGPSKLDYPFFGADATDQFDTITLRMESNDGWQWSTSTNRAYGRDEWGRRTQLAMGQPGSHGTHMHVYINGIYWGLYNPVERPDESFASTYIGGEKEEWDIQNSGRAVNGDLNSWNTMLDLARDVAAETAGSAAQIAAWEKLQGNSPDGTNNPAFEDYLDVDNLIDYMIINLYGGNSDWPHKNFYGGRQRGPESTGYKFFMWDSEWSLNLQSNVNSNRTGVDNGIAQPYGILKNVPEFQIRFADRLQKHFFNGGALYVNPDSPAWDPAHPENNLPAARFAEINATVASPLVAESARWGDQHRSNPHTVEASWRPTVDGLLANYFPQRSAIVLQQFTDAQLYSTVDAPTFNQHGGAVPSNFMLQITSGAGSPTIYFTLDGTDPREVGGAVSTGAQTYAGPMSLSGVQTVKARVLSGGVWSALTEATFAVGVAAASGNIAITEINYNPHDALEQFGEADVDNDKFEFLELRNISGQTVDLTGARLAEALVDNQQEGVNFTFPAMTLAPGDYVLVVEDLAAFESRYGTGLNVAGEWSGGLDNGGEQLTLLDIDNAIIQQFSYNDSGSWPGRADGNASSLEVIDTAGDYNNGSNWHSSIDFGGSPGAAGRSADERIVINEVLAHTDPPHTDTIELYNRSASQINVGSWYLSDTQNNYFKFTLPGNTIIGDNAYLTFDESDFNPGGGTLANDFALSSYGDEVWLLAADPTGMPTHFIDRVKFDATLRDVSIGRLPNGSPSANFVPLAQLSLGGANTAHRLGELIISEIQYNPTGPDAGLEFLEIYNTTTADIDLGEWRINGAVDFVLPAGELIAPGEAVVLVDFDPILDTAEANAFRAAYGIDASVTLLGPWQLGDVLDDGGERIDLEMRNDEIEPGETNFAYLLIDQADYDDMSPWPTAADAGGDALHRINTLAYGNDPASWRATAPTPGLAFPAEVIDRHIVYSGSLFDGIPVPNKTALMPAEQADFQHFTSYVHGITGLMIDIHGLSDASALNATDFRFRVGRTNDTSTWTEVTAPVTVNLLTGAGTTGSDRIVLTWPNGTIANTWLEVTMQPTANTGLAAADRFYFGNLVGDTDGNGLTNGTDFQAVRANPATILNPATVDSLFDLNRDSRVNATDLLIIRDYASVLGSNLPLISPTGTDGLAKASVAKSTPLVVDRLPTAIDRKPADAKSLDDHAESVALVPTADESARLQALLQLIGDSSESDLSSSDSLGRATESDRTDDLLDEFESLDKRS